MAKGIPAASGRSVPEQDAQHIFRRDVATARGRIPQFSDRIEYAKFYWTSTDDEFDEIEQSRTYDHFLEPLGWLKEYYQDDPVLEATLRRTYISKLVHELIYEGLEFKG